AGLYSAIVYKLLMSVLGLWKDSPTFATGPKSQYPNATLNFEITPEYLGVGYIIGPRIAAEMFSGGVLSWLVLIPLISLFVPEAQRVSDLHALGFSDAWIGGHSQAEQIYRAYIRYIGAGAVCCAGVMTLVRSLPTIVSSCRRRWMALMGAAIVCIASANAGATSQDLKTGYLVGATPVKQQLGLIIGVVVSTLVIGFTILLLDHSVPGELHGIGSAKMPAP